MIVVFWDIDGTLITTGRAGVPAWEQAVRETTGKDFDLSSIRVPGLTDYQIAVRTFEIVGVPVTGDRLKRMVARYEELLPSTLPLKQGQVMPHVREILEALQGRPDVRSYLLTGNTRAGARAKLTHYDVLKYFPDGAFAEDQGIRASIATRGAAARSSCSTSSSSATRRTTSKPQMRSAFARSRSRPVATRSKSSRRTIPGVCSSSFRLPTNFLS
jgi:hypothetical protein